MTLKEHALDYASRGWYVFPCIPRAKEPLTPHGFKEATRDPKVIESWWNRLPDANIGASMGHMGYITLDVDDRESFKRLEAKIGKLPKTLTSQSGSGRGGHLIFKQPPDKKLGNGEGGLKGQHINVRGHGGYIILPGSIHPSGKPYVWMNEIEPVEIPPELVKILEQTPEKTALIKNGKVCENSGRNNYLLSFGIALVDEAKTDNEVRAKMSAENQVRCEPPLDDAEFERVMVNVLNYRGRTNRYLNKFSDKPSWRKISQAEARHLPVPPVEWEVETLIERSSNPLLLFGDSECYKSWIALHIASCSATGEPVFGRFKVHQRGNSVFLNLDAGTVPTIRRLQVLGGDRTNLSLVSPGAWDPTQFQKMMEANVEGFIVVDCFNDLFEGKAEGASQAGEMRRSIKAIREQYERYRCGGIIIDHSKRNDSGKPVDNPITLLYGSSQKKATIRGIWFVEKIEDAPIDNGVRVKITCVKMSEAEKFKPFFVDITFDSNGVHFDYVNNSIILTPPGDDERLGQESLL
jgi:hypothetical protein